MTDTSLHNKVALVTGGGRGIGKAIALALAEGGCDVVVNYVSREADARQTADAIQALGRRALVVHGDVAKSRDVAALVAAAEAGLGPVDMLVNNAGRATIETIEQMTEASWNDCIQLNLSWRSAPTSRCCSPAMPTSRDGRSPSMAACTSRHHRATGRGPEGLLGESERPAPANSRATGASTMQAPRATLWRGGAS